MRNPLLLFDTICLLIAVVCVSCEKEYSSSHSCLQCHKPCHKFAPCSVYGVDEGYGAAVLCSLCQGNILSFTF